MKHERANNVDNSTTVVYIPTPRGWKCRRKNCTLTFKHRHTMWQALK
jgi:hypothetical protein